MRWFYSEEYNYGRGLPGEPREIHGFVLQKPAEIRRQLVDSGVVRDEDFQRPAAVTEDELPIVHGADMIARLHDSSAVAAAIEVPEAALLPPAVLWQAVVSPQLSAAGGTCEALRAAAAGEWAINLSGGFHHARSDLSHGFCLVNDVALAVARLRESGQMRPTIIVDLDLHQGDGNAFIFGAAADVFTLSIHQEWLFPMPKARSNLDVGLPEGVGDDEYLRLLDNALLQAREAFEPALIVYVAGSDPYAADPLGSLELSREGLVERDRRVSAFALANGCALVALPAGGYTAESAAITAAGFRAIEESSRRR